MESIAQELRNCVFQASLHALHKCRLLLHISNVLWSVCLLIYVLLWAHQWLVSIAETDELIKMLFGGRGTSLCGSSKPCIRWRHLANTVECPVHSCNAALCQIPLTTCCLSVHTEALYIWNDSHFSSVTLASSFSKLKLSNQLIDGLIDWVMVLCPTRHKISHFGDVSPSQSLGLVWKKLNLTQ